MENKRIMDIEKCKEIQSQIYACKLVSQEDHTAMYTELAVDNMYEKFLLGNYTGPSKCAEAVNHHLKGNHNVTILDVGAGTGFAGEELQKLGFQTIDALDPTSALLEIAIKKGVYRTFYNTAFTGNVECLPTDGYDVIVSSGAFTGEHMKCATLQEKIRCTKPGGIVIITMKEERLYTIKEYKGRLEPETKRLEEEGKWQMLERTVIPKYCFDKSGLLYVFKVK